MTQSAYANATINNMLGWLKGFATWVLRLFNLAGRGVFSPLAWLSENWLHLLIFLLIAGIVIDLVVWLIRWRPYWVWFHKKRILIEDENFFASEEAEDDEDDDLFDRDLFGGDEPEAPPRKRRRPAEDDGADEFVVASTVVRRTAPRTRDESGRDKGHDDRYRRPSTIVTKDPKVAHSGPTLHGEDNPESDIFATDFNVRPSAVRLDEDAVFNVSNLPVSEQPEDYEPRPAPQKKKRPRRA